MTDLRALREKYPQAQILLIAGGADKELDFSEFVKETPQYIKALILFRGVASDKIKKDFPVEKIPLYSDIGSMKEAFDLARGEAQNGDIILLSPAAASFGVFKNEYDRGDQFNELIRNF